MGSKTKGQLCSWWPRKQNSCYRSEHRKTENRLKRAKDVGENIRTVNGLERKKQSWRMAKRLGRRLQQVSARQSKGRSPQLCPTGKEKITNNTRRIYSKEDRKKGKEVNYYQLQCQGQTDKWLFTGNRAGFTIRWSRAETAWSRIRKTQIRTERTEKEWTQRKNRRVTR